MTSLSNCATKLLFMSPKLFKNYPNRLTSPLNINELFK